MLINFTKFLKLHFLLKLVFKKFYYPEPGAGAGRRNQSPSRLDRLKNTDTNELHLIPFNTGQRC